MLPSCVQKLPPHPLATVSKLLLLLLLPHSAAAAAAARVAG
jgi:hypothetical protein